MRVVLDQELEDRVVEEPGLHVLRKQRQAEVVLVRARAIELDAEHRGQGLVPRSVCVDEARDHLAGQVGRRAQKPRRQEDVAPAVAVAKRVRHLQADKRPGTQHLPEPRQALQAATEPQSECDSMGTPGTAPEAEGRPSAGA